MSARLPSFGKEWRLRWCVKTNQAGPLHRVAAITLNEERIGGQGVTACGQFLDMWMPGLLSRIGRKRCPRCCLAAGVPQGNGAPINEGIDA